MVSSDVDTTTLTRLEGFDFPVYVSGTEVARARGLAERTARTLSWLSQLVPLPTIPPLFVLDPEDWKRIALVPQYGLAHVNRTRIVMGLQTSGLWQTIVSGVWASLNQHDRLRLVQVYGDPPDVSCFADLVVSHELTHLADRPAHLDVNPEDKGWGFVPRVLWFVELFANLGLQGYVSECEPDELHRLETLFEVIGNIPANAWSINALDEMYEAMMSPDSDGANYCWYEFRLQIMAKRLWATGGVAAFKTLHTTLHGPVLADEELVELIATIDESVGNDVKDWLLNPLN